MLAARSADRGMRQALARLLLCRLGKHSAHPPFLRNRTHRFARCRYCHCDLVRTRDAWHPPKGHRIVWPSESPTAFQKASTESAAELISPDPKPEPTQEQREQTAKALLAILESLDRNRTAAEPVTPTAIQGAVHVLEAVSPPQPTPFCEAILPKACPADEIIPAVEAPASIALPNPPAPVAIAHADYDFMRDDDADFFEWESESIKTSAYAACAAADPPEDIRLDPAQPRIEAAKGGRNNARP